jgi:hypothetical protein
MKRRVILTAVLGLFIVFLPSIITETIAIPEYAKDLPQSLKNNCNVCHEKNSGGPLNVFGQDYVRSGLNIDAISGLDSDDDGFENGEELAAGALPGFSTSSPGNKRKELDPNLILVLAIILAGVGIAIRKRLSN